MGLAAHHQAAHLILLQIHLPSAQTEPTDVNMLVITPATQTALLLIHILPTPQDVLSAPPTDAAINLVIIRFLVILVQDIISVMALGSIAQAQLVQTAQRDAQIIVPVTISRTHVLQVLIAAASIATDIVPVLVTSQVLVEIQEVPILARTA